ncbi:MAG TPA: L,D-transpeptidase [Bacteroidales bacterium]|nr:L,D-transpeptidase [Bacteroidales bacterium]
MQLSLTFWVVLLLCSSACRNSSGREGSYIPRDGSDSLRLLHSYNVEDIATPVNEHIPLKRLMDSLGIDSSDLSIAVDKSDCLLSVLNDTVIIKQYPDVFGRNPTDDKTYEGDCCTPEGNFKVIAKYEHAMWSRFIWFDYPNEVSLQRHREAKRIGLVPDDRGPGGQVGIHGVPQGYDYLIQYRINWTAGCNSLKNKDVEDLYSCVYKGMVIKIVK